MCAYNNILQSQLAVQDPNMPPKIPNQEPKVNVYSVFLKALYHNPNTPTIANPARMAIR